MNASGGFTRSYRRKWDNPVFANKQQAAVWAWMCDVAQWQPAVIGTKWGTIELRRGELVIAERVIAEDFGMHRNTLRGLLNRMVDEGMIRLIRDRIPHRCGTIVSIVKYAEYQGFNGARYEGEDHTTENPGPYAGPHEDRIRTENNTVNYQKEGETVCVDANPAHACVREADTHTIPPSAFSNVVPISPPGGRQPMPAGWVPPEPWRRWAIGEGLETPELSALKFCDYWRDKRALKDEAGWWSAWQWWVGKDIQWERKHGRKTDGNHDALIHGLAGAFSDIVDAGPAGDGRGRGKAAVGSR